MAHLIDKDALVAEIRKMIKNAELYIEYHHDNNDRLCYSFKHQRLAMWELLSFIDTLEVKEVDLNNEYIEEIYSHLDSIKNTADRMTSGNFMHNRATIKFSANTIAKVLELIGLKAQKGEEL